MCFYEVMQVAQCWPYFESTILCPSSKNSGKVPDNKWKSIVNWEFEDLAT